MKETPYARALAEGHIVWHSRHYLPHTENRVQQLLTFRLNDAVPQEVVQAWKELLKEPTDNYSARRRRMILRKSIDKYEDAGYGACHLRNPQVGEMVQRALLHYDGSRYDLLRWCVMPNHVHLLIGVPKGISLSAVMHSLRSYTAHEANRMLGLNGTFWMQEYHDRYIRDAEHFANTVNYIDNNPVRAGLCSRPEDWPWSSCGYCKALEQPHPQNPE